MSDELTPRSLIWATDIDVLPADRIVERRDDHLLVRSPSNPDHHWGNFLIFDGAPGPGDGERWEAVFAAAFPQARHRALCWDDPDGTEGAVQSEFVRRGYRRMRNAGLIARPDEIVPHPRANREVEIRRLDPSPGADAALWEGTTALLLAVNDSEPEPSPDYEVFARRRQHDLRELFSRGHGGWYAALDPTDGRVVAGCGIVATGPRGRYQSVSTHPDHERRGICRRLIAEVAADAAARHHLRDLVIVADAEHHARGIYESLGFRVRERTVGVWRWPPARR